MHLIHHRDSHTRICICINIHIYTFLYNTGQVVQCRFYPYHLYRLYIHRCTFINMYKQMYLDKYVHIHIYIYIYIYSNIYTILYIHIFIYIDINLTREKSYKNVVSTPTLCIYLHTYKYIYICT
jgi:hypothetical protein